MRTAIDAGHPNNRKRSLEDLDAGVLATSTRGPVESRRRTWQEICEAWDITPWPITVESIRAVAASLKAGGYQSAQLYFDAAIWYQTHVLQETVPPTARRLMKSYVRSIKRGTPAAQLKAAFPLLELAVVVKPATFTEPYRPGSPPHAADALVLATWFMLREKEIAAARVRDLTLVLTTEPHQVQLSIPLHKTATGGDAQITHRRLKCACTSTTRPLCPTCAARRHLNRLHQAEMGDPDGPLFPTDQGTTPSREQNIQLIRRALEAAGIPVDYDDGMGHHKPIYGHAARVAGAHFLAAQGVPMAIIQILGRWSSSAIERYVQAAPIRRPGHGPGRTAYGHNRMGTDDHRPGPGDHSVQHPRPHADNRGHTNGPRGGTGRTGDTGPRYAARRGTEGNRRQGHTPHRPRQDGEDTPPGSGGREGGPETVEGAMRVAVRGLPLLPPDGNTTAGDTVQEVLEGRDPQHHRRRCPVGGV